MKLRLIFSCCLAAIAAAMVGCGATTGGHNLPPASRLMEPGPGVGGPGPGVIGMPTPGVAPAMYASPAMGSGMGSGMVVGSGTGMACAVPNGAGGGIAMGPATEVQVLFAKPQAMQVLFDAGGSYSSTPIITPGRQNFMQGGVYRLKITGITGREGTELYPTLEIGPPTRQTAAYLAHNAIPIQFTEEDFDQVLSGNFVTKVIYLPEPDFQELALAGVETLVSTRLDPGLDPIVEADRRGAILAVIRVGNKDMEVPGGTNVTPTYGGGAPAPAPATGVIPANYAPAGQGLIPTAIQTPVPAPTPAAAGSGVAQASLHSACSCGSGCQAGGGCLAGAFGGQEEFYGANSTPRGGYGPGGLPPGLTAAGQYGMPITGTPIGLPGPPHVPLGVPAGLKKHTMHNWTHRAIPDPVKHLKINVKQRPGLSYPQPPNRAWVVENAIHPMPFLGHDGGHDAGPDCPDGSCAPASHGGGLLGHMKGLLKH